MASRIKEGLLKRKQELEKQLAQLQPLQEDLAEVNQLLASYGRGGWEQSGHENGCRCSECDPSR